MMRNKSSCLNLFHLISVIIIILLSHSGTVKCADDFKPSDSVKFRLFYKEDETETDKSQRDFQFGFMGNISTGSSEIKNGYGGAFILAYNRLSPVVIRFIPNGYWAQFERIFTGDDILSFNLDLDLLLSATDKTLRPYAGLGLNYYNNSWPTDKPAGLHEFGPYSELTQSASYDYGKGFASHLRLGMEIVTERQINFIFDLKITNIKAEMPVIYHYINGDERRGTVAYKLNPISIYFGIITRIKK